MTILTKIVINHTDESRYPALTWIPCHMEWFNRFSFVSWQAAWTILAKIGCLPFQEACPLTLSRQGSGIQSSYCPESKQEVYSSRIMNLPSGGNNQHRKMFIVESKTKAMPTLIRLWIARESVAVKMCRLVPPVYLRY
jgi:hypothetical protein